MPAHLKAARFDAAPPLPDEGRSVLRFITAGSVDDGKSTLIGRLLYDTRQVLEDQLTAVEQASRKRGMAAVGPLAPHRRARGRARAGHHDRRRVPLFLDGTAEIHHRRHARATCSTPATWRRARAPRTPRSSWPMPRKACSNRARRHLYIAHLLGIRELVVAVNKMDLVDYERAAFEKVREAFEDFAEKLRAPAPRLRYIPLSALKGDMVVDRGERLGWYSGPTLLELLESIETAPKTAAALPLRFPVQLVQRTPERGRTYLGRIASGAIAAGQPHTRAPGRMCPPASKAIYRGAEAVHRASAGDSIAIALSDEIDIARGDLFSRPRTRAARDARLEATLVWLSGDALRPGGRYLVRHTTRTLKARLARIDHLIDIGTLAPVPPAGPIGANSIVRAALTAQQPFAFDAYRADRSTGAFILIDETTNQTVAAGLLE